MLAIEPDLVDMHLASARGAAAAGGDRRRAARRGVGAVSPTGVLGDPTGATLEDGRNLLEMLTDDLVTAVDDARNTW